MDHIILFNKIFNGRRAIKKEVQIVETMFARADLSQPANI